MVSRPLSALLGLGRTSPTTFRGSEGNGFGSVVLYGSHGPAVFPSLRISFDSGASVNTSKSSRAVGKARGRTDLLQLPR